jgi:REP element-mobilizing transposase RayT
MNNPLAYFITFSCKGARLHGDPRGSVDRDHNQPEDDYAPANPVRVSSEADRMNHGPIVLSAEQRVCLEATMHEVSKHRGWTIHALAVRSNHLHVVVSASGTSPERVMNDLRAYGTRRMREQGLLGSNTSLWTRHGSTKYLWKTVDIAEAVQYVDEWQDDPRRFN